MSESVSKSEGVSNVLTLSMSDSEVFTLSLSVSEPLTEVPSPKFQKILCPSPSLFRDTDSDTIPRPNSIMDHDLFELTMKLTK